MRMRSRGVSKCSGPYHSAMWSGSVHARNTCSRGASNMRVMTTSWETAAGVGSVILGSFPAEVLVEPVHPRLPRPLARGHPVDGLVERVGLHAARPPLGVAATDDEPGALEHLQVSG